MKSSQKKSPKKNENGSNGFRKKQYSLSYKKIRYKIRLKQSDNGARLTTRSFLHHSLNTPNGVLFENSLKKIDYFIFNKNFQPFLDGEITENYENGF